MSFNFRKKLPWQFWLGLAIGVVFLITIPPFQKPDEYAHYLRATAVSYGQWTCAQEVSLPDEALRFWRAVKQQGIEFHYDGKFSWDAVRLQMDSAQVSEKVWNSQRDTACSLPLAGFMVQGGALWLGRTLGLVDAPLYFFGRTIIFLLATIMIVLSLIRLPRYERGVLSLVFMLPIFQQQLSTFGYDAPHLVLGMAAIAQFFHLRLQSRVKFQGVAVLVLLLVLFIAVKSPAYLPFMALALPSAWHLLRERLSFSRRAGGMLLATLVLGSVFSIGIIAWIQPNVLNFLGHMWSYVAREGSFVQYTKMMLNSLYHFQEFYIRSSVGFLGWLDYEIPFSVFVFMIVACTGFVATHSPQLPLKKGEQVIILSILAGVALSVFFGMAYAWTPPGSSIIEGVQGRYFLTLFPLFFMLIPGLVPYFFRHHIWKILLLVFIVFSLRKSVLGRYAPLPENTTMQDIPTDSLSQKDASGSAQIDAAK